MTDQSMRELEREYHKSQDPQALERLIRAQQRAKEGQFYDLEQRLLKLSDTKVEGPAIANFKVSFSFPRARQTESLSQEIYSHLINSGNSAAESWNKEKGAVPWPDEQLYQSGLAKFHEKWLTIGLPLTPNWTLADPLLLVFSPKFTCAQDLIARQVGDWPELSTFSSHTLANRRHSTHRSSYANTEVDQEKKLDEEFQIVSTQFLIEFTSGVSSPAEIFLFQRVEENGPNSTDRRLKVNSLIIIDPFQIRSFTQEIYEF